MYQQLLGLGHDWEVSDTHIDEEEKQIIVTIQHAGAELRCPLCGNVCKRHDNAPVRKWRHLDSCQMRTFIQCALPRVRCADHGVKTVQVPWADSHSRLTMVFEQFCHQLLDACPVKSKVSKLTGLTYDELRQIDARSQGH